MKRPMMHPYDVSWVNQQSWNLDRGVVNLKLKYKIVLIFFFGPILQILSFNNTDKESGLSKPQISNILLCSDWSDDLVCCDWSNCLKLVGNETAIPISEFQL